MRRNCTTNPPSCVKIIVHIDGLVKHLSPLPFEKQLVCYRPGPKSAAEKTAAPEGGGFSFFERRHSDHARDGFGGYLYQPAVIGDEAVELALDVRELGVDGGGEAGAAGGAYLPVVEQGDAAAQLVRRFELLVAERLLLRDVALRSPGVAAELSSRTV